MKKSCINKLILVLSMLFIIACTRTQHDNALHHGKSGAHERSHSAVDSAIIALAKAANKPFPDDLPSIKAKKGFRLFPVEVNGEVRYDNRHTESISSWVGGRIERLYIQYNFQPVKKGQLLLEIYSPELVTAQGELLLLNPQQDAVLYQSALRKLQHLGMEKTQLAQLISSRKVLYRVPIYSPVSGYVLETNTPTAEGTSGSNLLGDNPDRTGTEENTPLLLREGQYLTKGQRLFTVYTDEQLVAAFAFRPEIAAQIHAGKKILFHSQHDRNKTYQGSIDLIEPTYTANEAFTIGRVYLSSKALRVGQLLQGTIAISTDKGWWIPKSAVLFSGAAKNAIVFRKTTTGFIPLAVQTGIQAAGWVQILSDIQGWDIAKEAEFLVDSEGFISTQH